MILLSAAFAAPPSDVPLPVNRSWDVIESDTPRERFAEAATALGDWEIDFAGVPVTGDTLAPLGSGEGSVTRQARETLGRAVDVEDFLYFLDDVLAAEERRGERFHVHSGRARSFGLVLHPDDVFKNRPRRYPRKKALPVDVPEPQTEIDTPAEDGALPGPAWTARYKTPSEREPMLKALAEERPDADFAERITDLLGQLESEGCEVYLASASRYRERGYLMWGAFILSRAKSESELTGHLDTLADRNRAWGLDVPITWEHPQGWEATREAARQMADTYDVVYATERGAKSSNHYGGTAVDLIAIDMPRRVTLTAPDGATRSFLLTGDEESRDLSLTPRMIDWIETHWGLRKLRSDYPHWDDSNR